MLLVCVCLCMLAAMPTTPKAWRELLTSRNQVRHISLPWLRAAYDQLKVKGRGDDVKRPALEKLMFAKLKLVPKECAFEGKRPHETSDPDAASRATRQLAKVFRTRISRSHGNYESYI